MIVLLVQFGLQNALRWQVEECGGKLRPNAERSMDVASRRAESVSVDVELSAASYRLTDGTSGGR
jgi:hypothetical protein